MKRKLSAEQIAQICKLYVEGKSSPKIAREFGVSKRLILQTLVENGINRRSRSECHRRYTLNHDAFANIQTEEQAYWAGFLLADGCVCYRGYGSHEISLSLSTKDEEHVHRFNSFLKSTYHVRRDEVKPCKRVKAFRYRATLTVRSSKLAADLAIVGVVSRKTYEARWPSSLLPELYPHFLRGLVDGDGSFYAERPVMRTRTDGQIVENKCVPGFSLIGTEHLIRGVQSFLVETCGLSPVKLRYDVTTTGERIYRLKYHGRGSVRKISELLYRGATVFLQRKYDKAILLVTDELPTGKSVTIQQEEDICRRFKNGETKKLLAAAFDLNETDVSQILVKNNIFRYVSSHKRGPYKRTEKRSELPGKSCEDSV